MKTLETGKDKIKKICEVIRKETIEPAQKESEVILTEAKTRAEEIIRDAKKMAEKLLHEARTSIEQEKNVFHSSLAQAGRQSMESLRQSIEKDLFNSELDRLVATQTSDPKVIAKLIDSLVEALQKDGIGAEVVAYIPKHVSAKEVNSFLAKSTLERLEGQTVQLTDIKGGVQVKLSGKHMTIDISDRAIQNLLSDYLRPGFRDLIFGKQA